LDDPEGERDKSEKECVVNKKPCEGKDEIREESGEGGGDSEGVKGSEDDEKSDARVGERTDFEAGGADKELGRSGFEK
jgi:hypothetical protein